MTPHSQQTDRVSVVTHAPDERAYTEVVRQLVTDRVASRIGAQDASLWGPDAEAEAAIRLSWVDLAESSRPLVDRIERLRADLAADGIDRVVLAGMGGSSLAPEVIAATAGVNLVTLDTTDADQVLAALVDLPRTVLVASSKSGGTVETDSHRRIFEAAFRDAGVDPRQHIVVVTDPGSPFTTIAADAGYRAVFEADPHVGGRYSALTAFGLVPAGLAGVDISALLDDAAAVSAELAADSEANPAVRLGALLGTAHAAGAEKVILADNGSGIVGFGDWAEQLIAESTGKQGRGLLPVVVESITASGFANAGTDATTVYIGADQPDRRAASGFSAAIAGPLAAQMLTWEYAIAIAGRIIGINPFDQPDVESAKEAARGLLDTPIDPAATPAGSARVTVDGVEVTGPEAVVSGATSLRQVFDAFVDMAPQHGYIAVQAYLNRLADDAPRLRAALARKTGLQTTFGWGPRFLHSTGQYHKGGHPNGVFVQITGPVFQDVAVPDRPYTLSSLQLAQAGGDAQVLRDHGRPVLTMHLAERDQGLNTLADALS